MELVLAATQSMLGNEIDDDMTPVGHVAKSLRKGTDEGEDSAQEYLRRIDTVAADGPAPLKQQALTVSQVKEISQESHAAIALILARYGQFEFFKFCYSMAVLLGSVMIIGVHVPDFEEDFEEYEKFTGDMTKVLQEGRKEGVRHFIAAGDPEMCGPQCWQGIDADLGGFKKFEAKP